MICLVLASPYLAVLSACAQWLFTFAVAHRVGLCCWLRAVGLGIQATSGQRGAAEATWLPDPGPYGLFGLGFGLAYVVARRALEGCSLQWLEWQACSWLVGF